MSFWAGRLSPSRDPLPGFPGKGRVRLATITGLAALVGADAWCLDGAVFRSTAWHTALWVIIAAGLAIGTFAFTRRKR